MLPQLPDAQISKPACAESCNHQDRMRKWFKPTAPVDDAAGMEEVQPSCGVQRNAAAAVAPQQLQPPLWIAQQLSQVAASTVPVISRVWPHQRMARAPSSWGGRSASRQKYSV